MRLPVLIAVACGLAAGEIAAPLPNPLGLDFPWDLAQVALPADAGDGPWQVRIPGCEPRPAQVVRADGRAHAWFVATVPKTGTTATLAPGEAPTPLAVREDDGHLVIATGAYDLRLPLLPAAGGALGTLPAPIAGMRPAGSTAWLGASRFTGDLRVASAGAEILERGPVRASVRLTYRFAAPSDAAADPRTPERPDARTFSATIRCVMGDPWIEVVEEYDLPGPAAWTWEMSAGWACDTALYVPWFSYGRFGGNSELKAKPLVPHYNQVGPFVALWPRWTQRPGGGQDFVLTRGGPTPEQKSQGDRLEAMAPYDAEAPALGVVAAWPTRWQDPNDQTIAVEVADGKQASARFPLHRGRRAYGLLCGPRRLFETTGRLNAVVRRHVDWTLAKQQQYVLEWPRDPAKAGPRIVIGRDELARLQADWQARRDTWEMRVLREALERAAKAEAGRKGDGLDGQLLRLITLGAATRAGPPSAGAWVGTRYQNDPLNPTSATRSLKRGWPGADLSAGGTPIGGAAQAAIGYIFSDADQWPGWLNGWHPGNPNFHTDKYAVAIFTGAALFDHPHAGRWLEWGLHQLRDDLRRVLLPPDGVGWECPGYSTYSLREQLDLARIFTNCGLGNPLADDPALAALVKGRGRWHRHLLTPGDPRLGGNRHQAPIGDTHRWGESDGHTFGGLARFFKAADPGFAAEMMGVWKLFREQGMHGGLIDDLIAVDQGITPTPLASMDWSSRAWHGFGAVLRSRFGTPQETFLCFKAGHATGHYHNDGLSFHFHGAGAPLALDYNCSYHPRGDHAALHNSMTFGVAKPFTHAGETAAVDAREQLDGAGVVGAFASTPAGDVVVAERAGTSLRLAPTYPDDAKFAYPYPRRTVERIVHRRAIVLVKHPAGGPLADYLVVRDECRSAEPQQLNLHLLAREVQVDGTRIRARGQWNVDALVALVEAAQPQVEIGRWFYFDEKSPGPGGLDPKAWHERIAASDGQALIPPAGHQGRWTCGEYQRWLRVATAPGSALLWVLYPQGAGTPEPAITAVPGGVRVALDDAVDTVWLGTPAVEGVAGQAVIEQGGARSVLLAPGTLPALGELRALHPAFGPTATADAR